MVIEWARILDKRPADRSLEDLEVIFNLIRSEKAFRRYHPIFLRQMCYYGFYEEIEKDVTLFRQGDMGDNWYTVLTGSLNIYENQASHSAQDTVSLCTLGVGTSFGESVLDNSPHTATVITNERCELLRIEQKDFRTLWEKNRQLMEDIVAPISTLRSLSSGDARQDDCTLSNGHIKSLPPSEKKDSLSPNGESTAQEPPPEPSPDLSRAGWVLKTLILCQSPHLIRDRRYHSDPARQLRTFRKCLVGSEMVDFLFELGIPQMRVPNRNLAIGMWQVLMEEGVIYHVTHEHQFKDKYLFYRFREDDQDGLSPTSEDLQVAEDELSDVLTMMFTRAPAAIFRMILRKPHCERTAEDEEIIYEELLKIKAVSHLSNRVKRELTGVLVFESHPKKGTVIFNQGEEGHSWYIVLKGSVNVVIYGKGTVCSLFAGDDFGKLALLNDAPRAATIVTRENNCVFLRVEKVDFNRILRDVEATLVRLKEHGKDVLLLQKVTPEDPPPDGSHANDRYTVMAGTPQRMLDYLLETCIDRPPDEITDTFIEDFLYSHVIFMPTHELCPELMKFFRIRTKNNEADTETQSQEEPSEPTEMDIEILTAKKKRIVRFVKKWASFIHSAFYDDECIGSFLQELLNQVIEDCETFGLQEEIDTVKQILEDKKRFEQEVTAVIHRWKVGPYGHIRLLSAGGSKDEEGTDFPRNIKANDEVVFRVYCEDQTYTTIKAPVGASAATIKSIVAEKLGLTGDLSLLEVKSTGERVIFKDSDICIPTGVSVNGRLFLVPSSQADQLRPLPEQDGPNAGTGVFLEGLSAAEIAYSMTMYEWELFTSIHEYELIYQVFGRSQHRRTTGNLDVFVRRFNEVQYWVGTEVTLASTPAKRAALLRKFIKVASYCREYKNMNSFFAIVMGLGNAYVSRLSQTWEKVPGKLKRTFADFEALIDPSRNHRKLRLYVAKMDVPLIPLIPLLLKDITFSHEGNKTFMEGLLNFEKMHLIAQVLRTIRRSKSQPLVLEQPSGSKNSQDLKNYVRNLRVIDNEKHLTKLSEIIEPRRQQ